MKVRAPAWTLAFSEVIATVEYIEDGQVCRCCPEKKGPRVRLTWGEKSHSQDTPWSEIRHADFVDLCEVIE